MSSQRMVVIGLDGAELQLIQPWADQGKLPNLQRLMQEGAYGLLRSTLPPMTPPAWTSYMTGKNIGKHGLPDFVVKLPDSYQFKAANARMRDGRTLWGILSAVGKSVGVVNVPMTYPPEEVNGFLIAGMDTPTLDNQFTYPPELKAALHTAVPEYAIDAGVHYLRHQRRLQQFIEEMFQVAHARVAAMKFLRKSFPTDFFTIVFRPVDWAQHWFWKHMDPNHPQHQPGDEAYAEVIFQAYKLMDETLGDLLDELDEDTTLVIISDHGGAPVGNKAVFLNTWLQQHGLLTFRTDVRQHPLGRLMSEARRLFLSKALWRARVWAKLHLPSSIIRALKRVFPQAKSRISSLVTFSEIEWSCTQAYAMEIRGGIWVNVKGREPEGIVSPGEEYEAVRDRIIEELRELRDPETGRRCVKKAFRREELYHGPYLGRIPDLLVLWEDDDGYSYQNRPSPLAKRIDPVEILTREEMKGKLIPNGTHSLYGICLFWGPPIRHDVRIEGASLMDIAPTILYLMGEAVPDDMDGRVLEEIVTEAFRSNNPVRTSVVESGDSRTVDRVAYSRDEEQEIEDRLRGLGYLG